MHHHIFIIIFSGKGIPLPGEGGKKMRLGLAIVFSVLAGGVDIPDTIKPGSARCSSPEVEDWGSVLCTVSPPATFEVVIPQCTPGQPYELKLSYEAVHPLHLSVIVQPLTQGRTLLNVEKAPFTCHNPPYIATITATQEGIPATPAADISLISLRLEPLWLGFIPGRHTPLVAILVVSVIIVSRIFLAEMVLRLVDVKVE